VVYISRRRNPTTIRSRAIALRRQARGSWKKPIAIELFEADEADRDRQRANLKFTIGYSQRFTQSSLRQEEDHDGTLGKAVSVMVQPASVAQSRTEDRKPGRLSRRRWNRPRPRFRVSGCRAAKPVRVYFAGAYGYMQRSTLL